MMHNRLLNLIKANRGRGRFETAFNAAGEPTIYLYDVIVSDEFWGGVSDSAFVQALNALDAPVINVRINSPGGDVFAGRAMEQAIRQHDSEIRVHIDGLAASAASYVAIAGDRVIAAPGAFVMIHKAWTIGWGNSDDMLSVAELLDKIDGTLVDTYVARTGADRDTVAQWLAAETWFTASEAKDNGFIDEITGETQRDTTASNAWDLSAYTNAPQPAPTTNEGPSDPDATGDDHRQPGSAYGMPPEVVNQSPATAYGEFHTEHLRRRLALVSTA